jgi:hypothetical protein
MDSCLSADDLNQLSSSWNFSRAPRTLSQEMHGRLAFLSTLALCGVLAVCTSSSNVPKSASGPRDPKPITIRAGIGPSTTAAIQARISIPRGGTYQYVLTPPPGRTTSAEQTSPYIQGITRCLKSGRVCELS